MPRWLTYLEYELRLKPGTRAVYKTAANKFLQFLATDGADYPVGKNKEVAEAIRWYLRWVTLMCAKPGREKADTSTLDTYRHALSSYYAWEVVENYRDKNPASKVHRTKQEADHRALLNGEQVRDLFAACDRVARPWTPAMARCILALMAGNALRVVEVQHLEVRDLDLYSREIRIEVQKNRQKSLLPIAEPFERIYRDWIGERDYLFEMAPRRGRPPEKPGTQRLLAYSPDRNIGDNGIYTLFRQLCRLAGIYQDDIHPHALRHFAITSYYEAGGLEDARILARHHDQKTTARYVHPSSRRLALIAQAPGLKIWHPERDVRPQFTLDFSAGDSESQD